MTGQPARGTVSLRDPDIGLRAAYSTRMHASKPTAS